MANFDPFSESGKAWLEENNVEDQYETLENVGFCVTRAHRIKHNIKHNIKNEVKQSIVEEEKPKDIFEK